MNFWLEKSRLFFCSWTLSPVSASWLQFTVRVCVCVFFFFSVRSCSPIAAEMAQAAFSEMV